MPYKIAGIDVHKKMLHVVFSDVEVDGEYQFERRRFDTSPSQLRLLAEWLLEQQVEEVAMESTAQYWKPVWGMLERQPLQYGSVQVRVGIVAYPLGPGGHGSILAPDHRVRCHAGKVDGVALCRMFSRAIRWELENAD